MRGRRPTPSKLKIQSISHRRVNEAEPEFTTGLPECPEWLSDAAKLEWSRVGPELARLGLLQIVDQAALAAYCQCYADWQECQRFIEQNGRVVVLRSDKGEVKAMIAAPQAGLALKYLDKIRQFAGEFGFTPSARSRIEVPTATTKEDLREEIQRRISRLEATSKKA